MEIRVPYDLATSATPTAELSQEWSYTKKKVFHQLGSGALLLVESEILMAWNPRRRRPGLWQTAVAIKEMVSHFGTEMSRRKYQINWQIGFKKSKGRLVEANEPGFRFGNQQINVLVGGVGQEVPIPWELEKRPKVILPKELIIRLTEVEAS